MVRDASILTGLSYGALIAPRLGAMNWVFFRGINGQVPPGSSTVGFHRRFGPGVLILCVATFIRHSVSGVPIIGFAVQGGGGVVWGVMYGEKSGTVNGF